MEDVIDIEGVPCYVESYSLGSDGEITIILKGNMRYRNGAYNIVSPPKEERDVVDALRETYSEDNDE
jgi:hypothetical protein